MRTKFLAIDRTAVSWQMNNFQIENIIKSPCRDISSYIDDQAAADRIPATTKRKTMVSRNTNKK